MKVLGIAGWSGAGKTVLITRLIPLLRARGLRVATIKQAHHAFDIDIPGKDSFEHRAAGAGEVIVASNRRVAQIQEVSPPSEPPLADLLGRLSPCDLVLVEGFKRQAHPKLEVFRAGQGRTPLHPTDGSIVAIAADAAFQGVTLPQIHIDAVEAIRDLVIAQAGALDDVIGKLNRNAAA